MPGDKPAHGYQVLYRSPAGTPEGYVRYRAKQSSEGMRSTGELTIDELVAVTPAAYEQLWRYCCDVDLVITVRAGDRPVDEHLGWLLEDGRTVRQQTRYDFVWVRVLDVVTALSSRRYGADGRLVVEVSDTARLRHRTLRPRRGPRRGQLRADATGRRAHAVGGRPGIAVRGGRLAPRPARRGADRRAPQRRPRPGRGHVPDLRRHRGAPPGSEPADAGSPTALNISSALARMRRGAGSVRTAQEASNA